MIEGDSTTHGGDIQEYPWMLAPAHFQTRRQLRAAGLGPNRQGVAAVMVGKRRGRRLVAHLFDVRKAAPKGVPTPAQLEAITKATQEYQIKAAERRGISRTELHQDVEPSPGWADTSTHTIQEGNTMSDTNLGDQQQLGTPAGHGQRLAYLLATVAVNQALHDDDRLAEAVAAAQAKGPDAVDELLRKSQETQAHAEARMETIPGHNQAATVAALADALVWHRNSEIAARHLNKLTRSYAQQWGVLIDTEEFSVGIDPDFDAVDAQNHAEAWRLREREDAVIDIVSAMPLTDAAKSAVSEAISAWRGIGISPVDPRAHLHDEATRREQLSSDLAAAQVTAADRARVEFVVDYLRGDTSQVDLLDSPVFIDPGEEARGRMPRLLEAFAHNPKAAKVVGEEISVMTAADQDLVRHAGREIAAGRASNFAVWPGYVDRYELAEDLTTYAAEVSELRGVADYLADGRMSAEERDTLGAVVSHGDTRASEQIPRIAEQHERLRATILNSKGLNAMERAHLISVIDDVDAGRIHSHKDLPELLFADERSKADADVDRIGKPASQLSAATREAIIQRVETAGGKVNHHTRTGDNLEFVATSIGDSIYSVACGARGQGVEHERKDYAAKRTRLDQALVKAGVDEAARTEIRELVDDRARQAGMLGKAAAQREQQWKAKTDRIIEARDDATAQRAAATAGRAQQSTSRACTTRPDRAAIASSPARSAAVSTATGRRRHLHHEEISR